MNPSRLALHARHFIILVELFNREEQDLEPHTRACALDDLRASRAILLDHGWEPDYEDELIMQEAGIHE